MNSLLPSENITDNNDGLVQDELQCQSMVSKDVYSIQGKLIGFIESVLKSKEAEYIFRVVGVNQSIGTGKFYLSHCNLDGEKLFLDMSL